MKWSPQPKGICARSDCGKDATQRGYCMNHYHLFRRNGVPYRQDELSEMGQTNAYERDARAALDADPPVIEWRKIRGGVKVHVSIYDPHADHPNPKPRGSKGLRPIDIEYLGEVS